ncbi:MAG: NAD(P)/FAD-dependent oxidoreductase [Bacilli bacterium]|nr:NAD(P)/FAD-dependent oxidoreductase [Bacilli bacterium]
MEKKHVIVIGAGIAGLTAGIYAAQSGLDVDVYESHSVPGGECTGWTRKGSYIEGCAHWIIGINPKSELYPLWRNVHAITDESVVYTTEYLSAFDVHGRTFYFYSDLTRLEKELFDFFPEDKKLIKRYMRGVKAYMHITVPVNMPLEKMNIFSLTAFGLRMVPVLGAFSKYTKESVEHFASRAKNPDLKDVLLRWLDGRYSQHSFFYVSQAAARRDAGVIQGGSLPMARRMADRLISVGGRLHLSSPIKRIIVENGKAIGVELLDGTKNTSDYVICSTDAHHAFSNLLEGKINDPYYDSRFLRPEDHPLIAGMLACFRTKKDVSNKPLMLDFNADITWQGCKLTHIPVRNFSFDKTINEGRGTLLTCLLPADAGLYGRLKSLAREDYLVAKEELLKEVAAEIEKEYGLEPGDVEPLDLTTPLTYERYCNAYEGSYMSFLTTTKAKGLMRKEKVKGVKNLYLCGQWIMPPGGLPIALFTGKHAAWHICHKEKIRFYNDKKKKTGGHYKMAVASSK